MKKKSLALRVVLFLITFVFASSCTTPGPASTQIPTKPSTPTLEDTLTPTVTHTSMPTATATPSPTPTLEPTLVSLVKPTLMIEDRSVIQISLGVPEGTDLTETGYMFQKVADTLGWELKTENTSTSGLGMGHFPYNGAGTITGWFELEPGNFVDRWYEDPPEGKIAGVMIIRGATTNLNWYILYSDFVPPKYDRSTPTPKIYTDMLNTFVTKDFVNAWNPCENYEYPDCVSMMDITPITEQELEALKMINNK